MDSSGAGGTLVMVGLIFVAVGLAIWFGPKIPLLGKLPGDLVIQRDRTNVFFPITTCLLISLVLTLVMNWFGRR
jgi:hypothetical protein